MRSNYGRALLGLATAMLTVAGCGNQSTAPSTRFAAGFAAFAGGGQRDLPGATLANPLVAKVFDDQGQPFAGTTVTWAVVSGGGTLSNVTTTTGADGTAHATLTLGPALGANMVSATTTIQAVTFTETARDTVTALRAKP